MKNLNNTQLILLFIFVVILLFSFREAQTPNGEVPIGTVVHSILPPDYFLAEYPNWVLLDGRPLKKDSKLNSLVTSYSEISMDSIPNGLGAFIRISNYNGKGLDKDSIRQIGSFQEDRTRLPKNSFTGIGHFNYVNSKNYVILDASGTMMPTTLPKFKTSEVDTSRTKVLIDGGGDFETRPKNISLFAYIKIN